MASLGLPCHQLFKYLDFLVFCTSLWQNNELNWTVIGTVFYGDKTNCTHFRHRTKEQSLHLDLRSKKYFTSLYSVPGPSNKTRSQGCFIKYVRENISYLTPIKYWKTLPTGIKEILSQHSAHTNCHEFSGFYEYTCTSVN